MLFVLYPHTRLYLGYILTLDVLSTLSCLPSRHLSTSVWMCYGFRYIVPFNPPLSLPKLLTYSFSQTYMPLVTSEWLCKDRARRQDVQCYLLQRAKRIWSADDSVLRAPQRFFNIFLTFRIYIRHVCSASIRIKVSSLSITFLLSGFAFSLFKSCSSNRYLLCLVLFISISCHHHHYRIAPHSPFLDPFLCHFYLPLAPPAPPLLNSNLKPFFNARMSGYGCLCSSNALGMTLTGHAATLASLPALKQSSK